MSDQYLTTRPWQPNFGVNDLAGEVKRALADGTLIQARLKGVERVQNQNHAWLVGQLFGAALRIASEEERGHTEVEMIDFDDGAHAATFRITRPSGAYLVSVVPQELA